MTEADYQHVIDELERLICETRHTLARFEATGMDEQMSDDYAKLEAIASQVVKEQRKYVLQMLDAQELSRSKLYDS